MAQRELLVRIVGDDDSLRRAFTRSERGAKRFERSMDSTFRGAVAGSGAFGALGRSVAFASSAFLGGAGVVLALKTASEQASSLNEEINKTRRLFGSGANEIVRWSEDSAEAVGLARSEALAAAGAFGAMFRTSGLGARQAADLSTEMVQLAADMASFNNEDPTDMLERLRSGLAGEAEPLRRFGVLLSEARVKTEAYRAGLARSGARLTEQQKVLARYNVILRDTVLQQGDFARTSDGLANQQRILRANVLDLAGALGETLNPLILEATEALNDWLNDPRNTENLQRNVEGLAGTFRDVVVALDEANDKGNRAMERLRNGVAIAAGETRKGLLGALSRLPTPLSDWAERERQETMRKLRQLRGEAVRSALDFQTALSESLEIKRRRPRTATAGQDPAADELITGTAAGGRTGRLTAEQRNRFFDNALARSLDRVQDSALREQITKLRRIQALITERIKVTKDITRKLNLEDDLVDVRRRIKSVQAQIAADLEAAADEAKRRIEEAEMRAKEAAERARELRNARQFRALGLSATGDERIPGLRSLRRQLGNVQDAVKGTFLDTDKTRGLMASIRRILSGGMGAVSEDVRAKVREMLADINRHLKEFGGAQTRFRKTSATQLLQGLGLDPAEIKAVRGRLAQVGVGGTVPSQRRGAFGMPLAPTAEIRNYIVVDGRTIEAPVTRQQRVRSRRNPQQKRGPAVAT